MRNLTASALLCLQDYDPVHRLVPQWAGLGAASPAVTAMAERQYRYDLNDNPTAIRDRHWGMSRDRYDAVAYQSGAEDELAPAFDKASFSEP